MKKSDVGFFQEQQPNGLVADSLMRLMTFLPLVAALLYLFITQWTYYSQVSLLMGFLKANIIDKATYVTIISTIKTTDYVLFSSLIGVAFTSKLIQKGQEIKAITDEQKATPESVKLAQVQVEQTKADKLPDQTQPPV